MYPSMKAEIAARDGDLRLSLLLGIAAWFLFLDHIPHNAVSALTLRNFGFSGATDLFVFVGGYTAAILYGKMMLERGFVVAATRIFRRVWQLYAAYVVLFVIYINLIGYVARKTAAPEIIHEFNVAGILGHTIRTLIYGLLLQAKPLNLDVLQLFIVLMAFFPIVLFGMMRRPNLTVAGSIALYLAARQFDWNLSSFPEGRWYFNPFSWQLLFVLGAWFALMGARQMRDHSFAAGNFDPAHRGLGLSVVRAGRDDGGEISAIGENSSRLPCSTSSFPTTRKTWPLTGCCISWRMAFLFTLMVPRNWRGFQWPALQPVVKCGEEWLAVFCAGVFLSFAGHFVLITGPNSLAMHILVSIAGISIMAAVAYYVSWSKRQDYKPALSTR